MATMEELETTKTEPEKKPIRRARGYFDYSLLFVWIFIMLLGYVLLYSASSYVALTSYGNSFYFLRKQVFSTAVGLLPMGFCTIIDYRRWRNFAKYAYMGSLITVFLVLSPIGIENHGAKRWVGVGPLQFQPAEVVKIGVILMTAYMLSKCGAHALRNVRICYQIYAPAIIGGVLIVGITSNLSSAIIIFGIGAIMIIIAGADKKFALSLVALGGLFLVVILIAGAAMGKGFRFSRIMVWLNPEEYADSGGYQVMQGLYAIGSGGLFGKGLGNSAQKMIIPEVQNDMILSIICEELGVFGAIMVLILFGMLLYRLLFIAQNAPDLYGSLIVTGIFAHIALQVILNVMVVINCIPTTGITLPFISYGGTSVLFLMAEMGLALGVSARIKIAE